MTWEELAREQKFDEIEKINSDRELNETLEYYLEIKKERNRLLSIEKKLEKMISEAFRIGIKFLD